MNNDFSMNIEQEEELNRSYISEINSFLATLITHTPEKQMNYDLSALLIAQFIVNEIKFKKNLLFTKHNTLKVLVNELESEDYNEEVFLNNTIELSYNILYELIMAEFFRVKKPEISEPLSKEETEEKRLVEELSDLYVINDLYTISKEKIFLHDFSKGEMSIDRNLVNKMFEKARIEIDESYKVYLNFVSLKEEGVFVRFNIISDELLKTNCYYYLEYVDSLVEFVELYNTLQDKEHTIELFNDLVKYLLEDETNEEISVSLKFKKIDDELMVREAFSELISEEQVNSKVRRLL